jgi:hypothetical protein
MKKILSSWVVLFLIASSVAQTTTASMKKASSAQSVAAQLQEFRDALAAQQKAIEALQRDNAMLKDGLRKRDAALDQALAAVSAAQTKADQAVAQAAQQAQQQQTVAQLSTDVADLKQNATSSALSLQETQKNMLAAVESPETLHFRGVAITPGGYLAAETVTRTRALGADIPTPFNSIPYDGATASHMAETFGSGRASRVSMLTEGKLGVAKLSGYIEADFLSSGVTSNNNQSNSYTLRQRQAWAQAALNSGWTFSGGQMWSLVTETRQGVEQRTQASPLTIDPNYNVGYSFARQYGFRVAKNFSDKLTWAFSIENSQATLGGHLAPGQNNFVLGSQGSNTGLYNATANYSFNPAPDFITKFVYQPTKSTHYEAFAIVSDFRDRIFPCGGIITATNGVLPAPVPCGTGNIPNSSGAYNSSKIGGGVGLNARATLAQKFEVGIHLFGGNGIGRYGAAGLPDVVARPDGVLVPVRNYQGLGTLEYHTKRLDIYANVGMEYAARTAYTVGGKGAGYGSNLFVNSGCYTEAPPTSPTTPVDTPTTTPGSTGSGTVPVSGPVAPITTGFNAANPANCTGDTRNIIEGTIGFWYRFYSGPKGRIQWGPQYSYIDRNAWSGVGGTPPAGVGGNPNATENMIFTSFRYYLP